MSSQTVISYILDDIPNNDNIGPGCHLKPWSVSTWSLPSRAASGQ